jgi:hypothetical protein
MRPRSLLAAAAAAIALSALPMTAQAATTELIDRSAYDSTTEVTAGSLHIDGATRGELGGYLDVTVTAADGSLPVGSNACEAASVDAVLTVSPGETLTAQVAGEICTGFYGDNYTVNAALRSQANRESPDRRRQSRKEPVSSDGSSVRRCNRYHAKPEAE